jgi:hypothetical protein
MIRRIAFTLLFAAALTGAALAQTNDQRAFWAEAFETGRSYSADMTLLAYCFRKDPQGAAAIYLGVIGDMNGVLELGRTGAVDGRQVAAFVHEVLDGTHFATPDAEDPALDKACVERDAQKAYFSLRPIAWPLSLRAPFKAK